MIKCNATGRHCHVMSTALAHPLPKVRGVLRTEDGNIVYRVRIDSMSTLGGQLRTWVEYVMPYCPWCGARLRAAVRRAREET